MMKKIMLCSLLFVLLLLSGCSGDVPNAPPPLLLTIGDQTVELHSGSYDWNITPALGQGESVIACGDHPLRGTYTIIETDANKAEATFAFHPTNYEIACWPEGTRINEIGESDTPPVLLIPHHDSFPLQEGTWIYQLHAKWQDDGYNGQADYAFSVTQN